MPHVPIAFSALLLSLALTGTAQAQPAAPVPADTARTYKHHLGLTASPVLNQFFTANRSLPVGLLYKRQTAPNKLWRFGLVVNQDYSRRDEFNTSPLSSVKSNDEYVRSNWGMSASVGREFTRRFSRHWTGAAGVDAGIGFSQYINEFSSQDPGNPSTGIPPTELLLASRFRYYRAALSPFVGLRYSLWPNLYVSAESAIQVAYSREVTESRYTVINLATGEVLSAKPYGPTNVTYQFVNARYKFVNQLSLHYMLGRP